MNRFGVSARAGKFPLFRRTGQILNLPVLYKLSHKSLGDDFLRCQFGQCVAPSVRR